MRLTLFLIAVGITLSANSQDIKRLDADNGFGDMHFGDSLTKFSTMKIIDQVEDSAYIFCRKTDDSLKFAGAEVDLVYTFYLKRLATVFISTKGEVNSRLVLKYLEDRYGKGSQEDKYLYNFLWNGQYTRLTYHEHVISMDAKIYISSLVFRKVYKGPEKRE